MKKSFNCLAIVLSSALLASGAAYAQSPTIVEGVPIKPAPKAFPTSEKARSDVKQEARTANKVAPKIGGEVAADAGKPTPADTTAMSATSDKTRSSVRAEARSQNKAVPKSVRPGGEGADTGKSNVR